MFDFDISSKLQKACLAAEVKVFFTRKENKERRKAEMSEKELKFRDQRLGILTRFQPDAFSF